MIFIEKIFKKIQKMFLFFYWTKKLAKIGKNSTLDKVTIYYPKNVFIGSNTRLNKGVILNAREKIEIGSYVHISHNSILNTGGLNYNKPIEERDHFAEKIIIEDGVWIGSGSSINPGIKIGEGSVIGAGSVVTHDIPSYVVAVGVPAKIIKKIEKK
ncbi:MAG: acyltransferase [Patescibacteria group bacterium]